MTLGPRQDHQHRAGVTEDATCIGTWLDVYKPPGAWFLRSPDGPHGWGHAARVVVWADALARVLTSDGQPVDREVTRWAAALHDVRRVNDGTDEGHGSRAARWALDHAHELRTDLAPQRLAMIAYCCCWHDVPDRQAPELTPELRCLKEADALDRVRYGVLDLGELRTAAARDLAPRARDLFRARTVRFPGATDDWESARDAACRLGLPSASCLQLDEDGPGVPERARTFCWSC